MMRTCLVKRGDMGKVYGPVMAAYVAACQLRAAGFRFSRWEPATGQYALGDFWMCRDTPEGTEFVQCDSLAEGPKALRDIYAKKGLKVAA